MTQSGKSQSTTQSSRLAQPEVGSLLTILSGLSFLVVCMILPLVGKAGVKTVHYQANWSAFAVALSVCTMFSVLAFRSKSIRSRIDGSPKPKLSALLVFFCGLLWIALLSGLLKI